MTENVVKFEKAHEAWEYMVEQQKLDNESIYSIPVNDMFSVIKRERPKSTLALWKIPENFNVNVLSDEMNGVHGLQSMFDGKHYDSKSKYRAELKAHGYVEMGNDAPKEKSSETRGDFVSKKEIAEIVNRYS